MFRTGSSAILLLVFSFSIGHGARTVYAEGQQDDVRALQTKEQQLSKKVRALRSEQKQLLLRKMLYSSDSKYLELDLRSGEGALKYRARILRIFRFTRRGRYPGQVPEGGILALSAKEDGPAAKRRLSFNSAAVVMEVKKKGGAHRRGNSFILSVGKRDLAAIYYALEKGSIAYFK